MKRKFIYTAVAESTRSKKPRLWPPLLPTKRNFFWVNATDTYNYMIRDPLVDWLKTVKKTGINNKNVFVDFILKRGKDFETNLIEYFKNQNIPIISVSDKITTQSCKMTKHLMHQGVPVIHSAPFQNGRMHIRGVIDLLIRSDYFSNLVDENPLSDQIEKIKAPFLTGNYHYIVVDIKFSTLPLRADGKHLLNSANYPAYKAQAWIYTQGIGHIQGYTSRYALILGRRWSFTRKGEKFSGTNCLTKLGLIDFQEIDAEYPNKVQNAIQWLRDIRREGKKWSLFPPSREELYPNMCVDSGEWNLQKEDIANRLGDITQIWYCGIKQRCNALQNGISSWRDIRCNSEKMGVRGLRASTIDKIIDINRQETDKIRPLRIESRLYNWQIEDDEIFVDFETFLDIFSPFQHLPLQEKTDGIFMIGVYYKENNVYKYKNFTAQSTSFEAEYKIMDDFARFVNAQGNPKIWFWNAEKNIWSTAENRQIDLAYNSEDNVRADHISDCWEIENWANLCLLFRTEPIVLKNCFKFGLKEISSTMRHHGMISSKIESKCDSGTIASVKAWQVYQNSNNPLNDPIMNDIALYNKFDVKVLQEILQYLRINCSQ
jgi:hypothetical protein